MSGRVLGERDLNRALLARQLLLERSRVPLPRALERIGGIQNQYAPNAYIRLRSCLDGFRRDDLTRALNRRKVVQATLMRTTIHLVSSQDYWPLAIGVRRARREWWLRLQKGTVSQHEMRRQAKRLRTALEEGPVSVRDLKEFASHFDLWIDLVRVPPSGTWERRRANIYGLAETWLEPGEVTEREGLEHLVRRYLGGFGPAPLADIAQWAGVPASMLTPVVERLILRRFKGESGELLDLPRAPLPDRDTPAPARLLPSWDATLLVHARRTGILPEPYRKIVFNIKKPQSMPTFLVDGRVAGAWKEERGRILLEPFGPVSRGARRELDEEGERMLALYV